MDMEEEVEWYEVYLGRFRVLVLVLKELTTDVKVDVSDWVHYWLDSLH